MPCSFFLVILQSHQNVYSLLLSRNKCDRLETYDTIGRKLSSHILTFLEIWPMIAELEPFKNSTQSPVCDRGRRTANAVKPSGLRSHGARYKQTTCITAVVPVRTSHKWPAAGQLVCNLQISDPQTEISQQTVRNIVTVSSCRKLQNIITFIAIIIIIIIKASPVAEISEFKDKN